MNPAVEVWCLPLSYGVGMTGLHDVAWPCLSSQERALAAAFTRADRQLSFVWGRALLRTALSRISQTVNPTDWSIVLADHGKPVMCSDAFPWVFNIANTKEWVVCAVSRVVQSVGVDVESPRAMPNALGLAARYFLPEECAWLESLGEKQREDAFLRLWSLKEAVAKGLGTGLAGGLNRFGFLGALNGGELSLWMDDDLRSAQPGAWHTRQWRLPDGAPLALAWLSEAPQGRFIDISVRVAPVQQGISLDLDAWLPLTAAQSVDKMAE